MIKRFMVFTTIILLVAVGASSITAFVWREQKDAELETLKGQVIALEQKLQRQIKGVQDQVTTDSASENPPSPVITTPTPVPQAEAERREVVRAASQDELLTEAVAKVTPAVVSIVITKDVPQLEVVYENPFGDDPFFRDFGVTIPRYRQKGTIKQKVGGGTGFLVSKNGYIVTNRHVVADDSASYTALLSKGQQKDIQVIYKDAIHDLAILKIDGNDYPSITLGDSDNLKLGQTVIAIGNALAEYNNSVSVGILSGLNRTIEASGEKLFGVLQTDAAINPGNSGGPLVSLDGKVIGVNVATIVGASSISFSIPINEVKRIMDKTVK